MIVIDFLRWFFIPHGVVVAEESGKISWLQAFFRLLSGAVKRYPNGPTHSDFATWVLLKRPLKRYRCRICRVYFWSWRKRGICYKFSCYRRRNQRAIRVVSDRKVR